MGKIKILDTFTSNKIAAGEVVERPESVVKELLENAIDAEANFIQVEIKDGGTSLIKVTDNGKGMDKEDALLAFKRHATSKITDAEDLDNITTFGFRGEALSSIAAVSQVLLNTCDDSSIGTQVKLIGGKITNEKEIAFSRGTSIEIRNLFFNVPARRKFVKSLSYETGLITELITRYSLGHSKIRFKLINNNNVVYDTAGKNAIEARLSAIYGDDLGPKFIYVHNEDFPEFQVSAWLAPKDYNRNTRNQQIFFINGRLVKSKDISRALDEAYHTFLPKGRFPVGLIHIKIPFDELDVNIHPTKLQVKIFNMEYMTTKITDIFKKALSQKDLIESKKVIKKETENKPKNIFYNDDLNYTQAEFVLKEEPVITKVTAPDIFKKEKYENNLENIKTEPEKNEFEVEVINEKPLIKKEDQPKKNEGISIRDIPNLKPLTQLNDTFILAENKTGLFIIDQHTCHERILYEEFINKEKNKEVLSESLLIPTSITLSGTQEGILIKNILLFSELGFVIEHFGSNTFIIRGIPLGLEIKDIKQFFIDLLDELEENNKISSVKIKEKILIMSSCKGAVKANQKLTYDEMVYLLKRLSKVDNPHTCPHGRPIIHHISMQKLYKIFHRGEFHSES